MEDGEEGRSNWGIQSAHRARKVVWQWKLNRPQSPEALDLEIDRDEDEEE